MAAAINQSRIQPFGSLEFIARQVVEGFITFVHVDLEAKPIPHGLSIEATNPEDIELQEQAKHLAL